MSKQQPEKEAAQGFSSDRLFRLLDNVQSQVRVFDTKAQIVMAGNGVLATAYSVMAPRYAKVLLAEGPWTFPHFAVLVTASAGLIVFALSLIHAFLTLLPRTELKQPSSKLFFGHLVKQYGNEYERCFGEMCAVTEEALRRDLTNQILANSNICDKKCTHAAMALRFLFASFACWIVLFLLTLPEAA